MAATDDTIILLLSAFLVILVVALMLVVRSYREKIADLEFRARSQSVTYGKTTEQFAPFMASYPFDARNFRFLGSPIDGVQFEADRIVFVEFKAAGGRLSPRQGEIRKLVEEKRVEWLTFEVK